MLLAFNAHHNPSENFTRLSIWAAALRMIELGLGIGVLPVDMQAGALPASLVALPLVPEVSVTTVILSL